jgi:tetratricopeptide (TPR) repeat protein
MEQMFELSKRDLETSLRLNPKSYLAILNLLNIAQFEGADRVADKYLALGNAVLPSNFIVRARYLIHLTPKWGGSYRRMEKFIDECESQGLAQDKIDLLNAIKIDDQGTAAEERGNIEQARAEFKKALILSRSAGQRFRQDYLSSSSRICAEPEHRSKEYCR